MRLLSRRTRGSPSRRPGAQHRHHRRAACAPNALGALRLVHGPRLPDARSSADHRRPVPRAEARSVFVGGVLMALGQFVLFGVRELVLHRAAPAHHRQRLLQAEHLDPGRQPLPAGRLRAATAPSPSSTWASTSAPSSATSSAARSRPCYGWRYGFLAAGVGMCLGLVVTRSARSTLAPDTLTEARAASSRAEAEKQPLTKRRVEARLGARRPLRAQHRLLGRLRAAGQHDADVGRREDDLAGVLGFQIPSTWFQSVNPFFIFLFAPFLDCSGRWQNKRGKEPSSVAKMAIGCFILGALVHRDGHRRASRRRRQGQPLLADLLHAAPHDRRALPLAHRPLARDQGRAGAHRLDDDGHVVPLELLRQHPLAATSASSTRRCPKETFFMLLMALGIAAGVAIWAVQQAAEERHAAGVLAWRGLRRER